MLRFSHVLDQTGDVLLLDFGGHQIRESLCAGSTMRNG
jgi:hypothetical protein